MGQRIITTRVRPPRGLVLIDSAAPPADLVKIVRFLTQIWGGRYYPILPVNPDLIDDLTLFRLKHNRPDYVFSVGVDKDIWKNPIHEACQPREYRLLTDADFEEDVRDIFGLRVCHSDRAVISLFESRMKPSTILRPVKVVETTSEEWSPYLSVMYGHHGVDLKEKYRDEQEVVENLDTVGFIRLHQDFVEGRKLSWLDAGNYGLNRLLTNIGQVDPTIVVVGDKISDLCHFWNFRAVADNTATSWIIPIPINDALSHEVQDALVEWLIACSWHATPDYCTITSLSADEEITKSLADALKAKFNGTEIKYVDVLQPRTRIPRVIPFEEELTWPVEIDGRRLTIAPPSVNTFKPKGHRESWLVDLLKDNKTGYAVGEMCLPNSVIVPEVINSPCPPQVGLPSPRIFGYGYDAVNILCTAKEKPISWCIPSAEEVLEEILQEHGFEIQPDEKRNGYLPVIDRFGGLYQATKALSGDRGKLIETLRAGKVRSPQELAKLDTAKQNSQIGPDGFIFLAKEAAGKAGLKNSKLGERHSIEKIRQYLQHESDRVQRIGIQRTVEYWDGKNPMDSTVQALLEHWANSKVVKRKWQIGPCSKCGRKRVYVDELELSQLPNCPHCGGSIAIKGGFEVAYSLEPTVRNALNEGIGTVVLAGQFLKNMRHTGFFWLPGVKYKLNQTHGDIDLLACCDGLLIFGECKGLADTPHDAETWGSVVDQFLETADVALTCGGDIAILAAMVEDYPPDVKSKIEEELNGKIPYLLLTREDMENGVRKGADEDQPPKRIEGLMPVVYPERENDFEGVRTIRMGGMTYTKRGKQ